MSHYDEQREQYQDEQQRTDSFKRDCMEEDEKRLDEFLSVNKSNRTLYRIKSKHTRNIRVGLAWWFKNIRFSG